MASEGHIRVTYFLNLIKLNKVCNKCKKDQITTLTNRVYEVLSPVLTKLLHFSFSLFAISSLIRSRIRC